MWLLLLYDVVVVVSGDDGVVGGIDVEESWAVVVGVVDVVVGWVDVVVGVVVVVVDGVVDW